MSDRTQYSESVLVPPHFAPKLQGGLRLDRAPRNASAINTSETAKLAVSNKLRPIATNSEPVVAPEITPNEPDETLGFMKMTS